jgi:hypothetical protein
MSIVVCTNRGWFLAGAPGLLDTGIVPTLGWTPRRMSLPPRSSR